MPGLDQLLHHGARQIDRDREAVARGKAGLARDGRVDADDLTADVDERPARVAGVDRRVGLDEILNRVAGLLQALKQPALGADDARRHGEGERLAQRVPDRQRPLTHPGRVGIAELNRGQATRVDLDDGDVGVGIGADHLGRELTLVVQLHGDLVGAGDDVVVREDVAVARDDESRARALLHLRPPAEVREEVLEARRQPLVLRALDLLRADEYDGRLHVLRDADERVAQVRRRFERGRRQARRRRLCGGDRLRRVAPVGKTERGRERQPEHERYRHQRSELQPIPRTYRHRRSFSGRGYFFLSSSTIS